jgi:hypothetical protein
MPTFTIDRKDRDYRKPKLDLAEASQMASLGFRFSIFNPEGGEFQLSVPYRIADDRERGMLIFMQERSTLRRSGG